jgi:hypothetical protein
VEQLENGILCVVPPSLMKRLKQHFVTLPCGVDVILGVNGYIWITGVLVRACVRGAVGDHQGSSKGVVHGVWSQRNVPPPPTPPRHPLCHHPCG